MNIPDADDSKQFTVRRNGTVYIGTYEVTGEIVTVRYRKAVQSAPLRGLQPLQVARRLLSELVGEVGDSEGL